MATEVVKIVDPDNGSGTNYTSLSAWEAGEQKDLVSADEIAVAKCRCTNGTADSTNTDISGWTTDSTRYCKIWCDPSDTGGDGRSGSYAHLGVWPSSGKIYRFTARLRYYNHIVVENIAIKASIGVNGGCIEKSAETPSVFRRCYIENTYTGAAYFNTNDGSDYFFNSILITVGGYNHSRCAVATSTNTSGVYFYNCTGIATGTVNAVFGSIYSTRKMYCYNCIAVANAFYTGGKAYYGEGGGTVYGNYTTASDSSYPSGASNYWTGVTPTFVDSSNKNFHLAASDTVAKDKGYDYSAAGYSDDIDGQTRTGTWDIGADEYVAAGISLPVAMRYYRNRRIYC